MKKSYQYLHLLIVAAFFLSSCEKEGDSVFTNSTGKGGSMARFALGPNHLYVVNDYSLQVLELTSNGSMQLKTTTDIGFGIETIAIRGNTLFLGAMDGMYIYSVNDPTNPELLSRYDHIIACDPVVVSGKYAYVTLRINASCRAAGTDALEVINISNTSNPVLVKSYPIDSPYGLGIDGKTLFVCEGYGGLQIFDATKPDSLVTIKQYDDINAFDVIPNNGVLIVTGSDGIFQYDYTNLTDIKLLSQIKVQ